MIGNMMTSLSTLMHEVKDFNSYLRLMSIPPCTLCPLCQIQLDSMKTAVIIDACRTPIGRAHAEKGVFRDVRSDDLAVAVVRALVERTGIDPAAIEDVVLGNTQQQREQGFNVARTVGLMAGLPVEAGGATVNRLCGSSLQALAQASHAIVADAEDVQIVGGLEHMHHIPMDAGIDLNPKLFTRTSKGALMMGITAEFLAQTQGISREEQDQLRPRQPSESHRRLRREAAQFARRDRSHLGPRRSRQPHPRRARPMRPPRHQPGSARRAAAGVHARHGHGDGRQQLAAQRRRRGAADHERRTAKSLGLKPLVKVRATAVAGVDPAVMGTGPVPATQKALKRAGLKLDDIDLIELNEAFAAQALACIRMLELDESKVNVRGGAIAIGHPLGASGARIATTLIHAMHDRDATLGLATMCIGVGQGIAVIFERV